MPTWFAPFWVFTDKYQLGASALKEILSCYCYFPWTEADHDVEEIWALFQRHGGQIALHRDRIDFWIPPQYDVIVQIAFPELLRQPELDYGECQRYQFQELTPD